MSINTLRHHADPTEVLHDPSLISLEGIPPLKAVAMENAVAEFAEPIADALSIDPELLEEVILASEALRAAAVTGSISEPKLPVTAKEIAAADDKYALIKERLDADTMADNSVDSILEYERGVGVPEREGSYWMTRGSLGLMSLCLMQSKNTSKGIQSLLDKEALRWLSSNGRPVRRILRDVEHIAPLVDEVQPQAPELPNRKVRFMEAYGWEALYAENYPDQAAPSEDRNLEE